MFANDRKCPVQDGVNAKQALTGASKDMAAVHAEKAALLGQWQSALQAIRKRDEALKVCRAFVGSAQLADLSPSSLG